MLWVWVLTGVGSGTQDMDDGWGGFGSCLVFCLG